MAAYIDQLIMLMAGLYAAGVGFGWLASPASGTAAAGWQRQFGGLFRVLGPLLVTIAIILTIAEIARPA